MDFEEEDIRPFSSVSRPRTGLENRPTTGQRSPVGAVESFRPVTGASLRTSPQPPSEDQTV